MPLPQSFLRPRPAYARVSATATFTLLLLFTLLVFFAAAQTQVQKNDYRVRYASSERVFYPEHFFNTRDGGTVISGRIGYWNDSSKLFVMKIDRFGNSLWSKYISNQGRVSEYNACETSDGGIVFAGSSSLSPAPEMTNICLYKFGCNGELLWSKMLSVPGITGTYSSMRPFSLREGRNSDIILSASNTSSAPTEQIALICRINASGNLVWSKSYQGYDQNAAEYASSCFYANDKIIVFGYKRIVTTYIDYDRRLFAMRLNYETGDMEFIRGYAYSEFYTNYSLYLGATKVHFDVSQLSDNRFAIFGVFANGTKTEGYFYKIIIGADLLIASARAYAVPVPLHQGWAKISVFPNGNVNIVSALNNGDPNTHLFWYTADSLHSVKKSVVFPTGADAVALQYNVAQNGSAGSNYALGLASNVVQKYVVEAASFENDNPEMRACLQTRDTNLVTQVNFNPGYFTWSWTAVKTGTALLFPLPALAEDIQLTTTFVCKGGSYQGPGLSCNATLPVKLLSFTGQALSAGNLLEWTTEEHGDAENYVLQSSEDGLNFKDIFTQLVQPATGNRRYTYFDKQPHAAAAIQYRVQSTLPDGSKSFSKLITLKRSAAVKQFSVYPNPARNTVSIAGGAQPEKVEWFNASGVRVKSVISPEIGQPLNIAGLPKGLYLVRIYQQGIITHIKMIRN